MATAVERAKDWWESKAPRERKLIAALGATLVVGIMLWVGLTIRGGLRSIEKKNQSTREALAAVDTQRQLKASRAAQAPTVTIPDTQVALDSYLEPIIKDVGLESPTYPAPKETVKGAFAEVTIRVALKELNIRQLKDLLEKVETTNPVVAVTELHVKKSFRDSEKLDVEMTVATFYKKGAAAAKPGAAGATGAAPAAGKGGS